jgi:phosphoribosylformylglycinamidine synthase
MHRDAAHRAVAGDPFNPAGIDLGEAAHRVLSHPAVASKRFLITIGDRTVGGLVARDPMVGPWQVPVGDAAVTLSGFTATTGEAFTVGERTPLAIIDAPASGRLAVAEAVTNMAGVPVRRISDIRLSANWMAAAGEPGQDADLFDTVRAVGLELCPELGIAIPVGKDSLSLKTAWQTNGEERKVTSPVSLVVSAFAPVEDVYRCLTPELSRGGSTRLVLFDLSAGTDRLGGSILAQVFGGFGNEAPDLDDAERLKAFFELVQDLNRAGEVLAFHDRSDGGLFATVCEMAFAARCGLELELDVPRASLMARLFTEEPGAVLQVRAEQAEAVLRRADVAGLGDCVHDIGRVRDGARLLISDAEGTAADLDLVSLNRSWGEVSHAVARLRDKPACADAERDRQVDPARWDKPDLAPRLTFDAEQDISAPYLASGARPPVAILREQGVNGHLEMAAAFHLAGFEAVDVHMSDLAAGRFQLSQFRGLVACGGFSYGDVLGAGRGWAKSILFNDDLRARFEAFFAREDTFALGVCNGCQALSALREIIPGTSHWPDFLRNESEQFEARLSLVRVEESPSLFFAGMAGSLLPVATAHGEGRADFAGTPPGEHRVALRYVEPDGTPATAYPQNPNGSPAGVTGVCNEDGRVTIMMPHPERTLRTVNFSWAPAEWGPTSPWMRMFRNARAWID